MLNLYPALQPFAIHHLAVDNIHTIYVEESGNPKGLPVVFLHGGPGAGVHPDCRRYFDPKVYRIVLFDQRGAGQSTPHAELQNNTSQALIQDIEAIRQYLHIEQWIVFGGSWGSTLGLLYAENYPLQTLALVLRGIFLCRKQDIDWFYEPGGASRVFPDYWEKFYHYLPEDKRDNVVAQYYRLLTGEDELARMSAAKAWSEWEGVCATLQPNPSIVQRFTSPHVALSLSRIEAHYFMNNIFLHDNQLLAEAYKIAHIPGFIIHGRYDMICPLDNAFALHKAWPKAELQIVRDAGHAVCEPGIIHALIHATNTLAKIFT